MTAPLKLQRSLNLPAPNSPLKHQAKALPSNSRGTTTQRPTTATTPCRRPNLNSKSTKASTHQPVSSTAAHPRSNGSQTSPTAHSSLNRLDRLNVSPTKASTCRVHRLHNRLLSQPLSSLSFSRNRTSCWARTGTPPPLRSSTEETVYIVCLNDMNVKDKPQ